MSPAVPGPVNRKSAKAQDSGLRIEEQLKDALNDTRKLIAWRSPGIRHPRQNGVNYLPDAGAWLPELDGLAPDLHPNVRSRRGGPSLNLLLEFKGQRTSGSASAKLETAISDMAYLCDDLRTVGAVILDTAQVLKDEQIQWLKDCGEKGCVVVLTKEEVENGELNDAARRMWRSRNSMYRRTGKDGHLKSKRQRKTAARHDEGYEDRAKSRDAMRERCGR